MSNIFGNLKNAAAKAEAVTDRVGGGFSVHDTAIYEGDLKVAYAGQSSGGANFLQIIIENVKNATTGAPAADFREQVYFTSGRDKGQSPTYEKDGKQYFLPGYTLANDIMVMTSGVELTDAAFEEKIVNIYNYDLKKEEPKSVPVAVDAIGNRIAFAVYKVLEDKKEKSGDTYVPTGESREKAQLEKIFHPDLHVTVLEAQNAVANDEEPTAEHAVFWGAWLEKHDGKVQDRTTKGAGTPGKPGTPPQAGAAGGVAGAAKKSLFGKK